MTMDRGRTRCTVAVVGGGIAGLSLATELKHLGIDDIVVIERESTAGGVPRHCGHYPFGWTEFKRVLKGPEYAARLVTQAQAAGVRVRTGTSVTQLHPDGYLSLAGSEGESTLQARRVVLCTGTREGTLAQRFVGGQRPQGILPTGAVQSMVYQHNMRPFNRPVILGTELVSMSAIMTCKHIGIRPVAMLEENVRTTVPGFMRAYPLINRIPLFTNIRNLRVHGSQRVQAVEFNDATGTSRTLETDGLIVSGQFRPESALLRNSHLAMDSLTGGPIIDQYYRTSDPAYFCTGNLLRPVENASWCWEEGKAAARTLADDLQRPVHEEIDHGVNLELAHPALKLVVPQRIRSSILQPGMNHLQVRVNEPVNAQLVIKSGEEIIWSGRLTSLPERRRLIPMQSLLSFVNGCTESTSVQLGLET